MEDSIPQLDGVDDKDLEKFPTTGRRRNANQTVKTASKRHLKSASKTEKSEEAPLVVSKYYSKRQDGVGSEARALSKKMRLKYELHDEVKVELTRCENAAARKKTSEMSENYNSGHADDPNSENDDRSEAEKVETSATDGRKQRKIKKETESQVSIADSQQ